MVPKDWQHPKSDDDCYIPLMDRFLDRVSEWDAGHEKWQQGFRDDFRGGWKPLSDDELSMTYEEWSGARPDPDEYMPQWRDEERTHLMMYEDTTEGTPLSPAFETPEELARWLADNNASAIGYQGATYEHWLAMIGDGWAPSMVVIGGQLKSGVAASTDQPIPEPQVVQGKVEE